MPIQLENGYTKIANEILENLCTADFSQYEWRVLMAVFRKTYGYNKKEDWISNSQMVELTGIHKAHISRTIKKLIKRGVVTKRGNKLSFNKDLSSWLPKEVTIKKLPKEVTQLPKEVTGVTQTGNKSYPKRRTQKKKETITKETIQKKYTSIKNLTENDFEEIANDYKVPVSFVLSKLEDMQNWIEAKGKRYKNYKSALRNWVKKDAIKRIDNAKQSNNKRSIDLSNL